MSDQFAESIARTLRAMDPPHHSAADYVLSLAAATEMAGALAAEWDANSWTEWGIAYGAEDPGSAAGVHYVGEEQADAYEMLQWFAQPAVLVGREVRATEWTAPEPPEPAEETT